jgi:translocation and assembly module TamB
VSETPPKTRFSLFQKILLTAFAGGILLVFGALVYVRTDSFQSMVHRRVISALEQMTGGRVELGRLTVVPFRFRVEVRDLTIHGKEAPGEVPYAHADHLIAEIKIISIFEKEFGFRSIGLDHPVIHIITYSDGTTNQPTPKIQRSSERSPVQQLFSLSMSRLQVVNGELLWNDQRIPLDFTAGEVSSEMNYSILRRRYESYIRVKKLESVLPGSRPFTSALQAQLSLGEEYIELQSLELSSGHSRLEASGRLDDFRTLHFSGSYNARLDLTEAGWMLNLRQLRAGTVQLNGNGSFSLGDFRANGKLLVKDLEWRDAFVNLRRSGLSSHYDLSRSQLKLSQMQLSALGGSASGEAKVTNWLENTPSSSKRKRASGEEQRGALTLKFKDLSVTELASALATRKIPLDRLKFAGSAAGSVDANWRGSVRNMEAAFTVNVVPPTSPSTSQIPLTATSSGTYRRTADELELSSFDASTRATQIRAAGRLSSSSSVRFFINTTNLAEWQPLLTALRGPQIPIVLGGRAVFQGTATGRVSDFALAGHMHMTNFDSLVSTSAAAKPKPLHWDSLAVDLQASPRSVSARNGLLVRGNTTMAFDASALLQNGELSETSLFTARVQVRNESFADLQSLLGYDYPITGQADVVLTASGTRMSPHAEGQLELRNGLVYGQPISLFKSDLRYNAGEFQLNNIQLGYKEARITGGAAYSPDSRDFHFNLSGTGFDLLHFAQVQKSHMTVEGRMDFTAQGSGNIDAPIINASVHLRDLAFDTERAGDFDFEAVTRGADMRLTGRSKFEKAQLTIDGDIRLRDKWPANLNLRLSDLDIDSLLRAYLKDRVTGHSAAAGELQISGPLREPRALSVHGNLSHLSFDVEKIAVSNEGPIRFAVNNQVLSLEQLRLLGEGTDITARGTVQMAGDHELALRADGRLNLKLIENFSPDLSASGVVNVGINVEGTYARPSLLGKVDVSNSSISSIDLPNSFSNMNGTLVFNQDRLDIQALTAQVGGGAVKLTGYVTYTPRLSFNITAQGQDVRLRPAGISATANSELHLVGTAADALLSGDVTVVKLNVAPGFDFGRYLETSKQGATLPQTNTLLNNVRLDIHVVTTPELQMQSSLAKLAGEADLHLRGTLVRPVVLGRVDIMEGEVSFNGRKYRLERGEVTFTGPTGVKPTLDLQATTHVRDYDITLGVNGTPDKLNFTYRSEPPLPSADIVALLALGRTQSESATLSTSSQTAFSQEATNVILNQALNATLNNRAQRLFGISSIKVDPQGLNTETTPTRSAPAVTIEQQISNDFTLTYSTEVSQASQQVIQAEYNVTRNISIVGLRDQNGVVSFDIRLRQRRK